jgi:hypothetical protein
MTVFTIQIVSDGIFMEVRCGQQGKTCPGGKDSKRYSKENPQLPDSTKERKD